MTLSNLLVYAVLTWNTPVLPPFELVAECRNIHTAIRGTQATNPGFPDGTKLVAQTMRGFVNTLLNLGMPSPAFSFDAVYLFEDKSDDTVLVVFVNVDCIQASTWVPGPIIRQAIKEANG